MKHFLTRCSINAILLLTFITFPTAQAAGEYRDFYISISDALMQSKQDKDAEAEATIKKIAEDWQQVTSSEKDAKAEVDKALAEVEAAQDNDARVTALQQLSKKIVALEKLENPVDEAAQRAEFGQKMQPVIKAFDEAIDTGDLAVIDNAYKEFNLKWNKYERPVREQSIAMYGQIETQMAFIRIAISAEEPDLAAVDVQYDELKKTIADFVAGEETAAAVEGEYSLQTLIDYIAEAQNAIDDKKYAEAAESLRQFIIIWPTVEIDISTRDGKLYTELESQMPLLVSALMKSDVDEAPINEKLTNYKTQIALIHAESGSSYHFWDAALILLREGLEALLIILALAAFLKKAGQEHLKAWIYIGAGVGIAASVGAAIIMSVVFQSTNMDANREIIEGYVGLFAAAMMIGVGVWLHNKASVKSWNNYIAKRMDHAISTQSVFAMAMISFLSVFREGAETIIFYIGIAPKMETSQFILGIVVALVILAIVAVVLFKVSDKIPVHKFFAVATVLIYVLAFKIIGVSIHTLQLMDRMPTHIIDGLPVLPNIGFYPTWETILGQLVLVVFIVVAIIWKRKNEK